MAITVTWDHSTLYDQPGTDTCVVSGKYETGRYFRHKGKRVFVGKSSWAKAVEDFEEFRVLLEKNVVFKKGYPS